MDARTDARRAPHKKKRRKWKRKLPIEYTAVIKQKK
jgi:hypothetical protein